MKPERIICPYCNVPADFVDSSVIYKRSYGMIYLCSNFPECDAYVGVHNGTAKPLGKMANRELREARKKAHAAFDPLWQEKLIITQKNNRHYSKSRARNEMYAWLANELGIPKARCHIAMFDVETCKQVVEVCRLDRNVKPITTFGEQLRDAILNSTNKEENHEQ